MNNEMNHDIESQNDYQAEEPINNNYSGICCKCIAGIMLSALIIYMFYTIIVPQQETIQYNDITPYMYLHKFRFLSSNATCEPIGTPFGRGFASLVFFGWGFMLKTCYETIWIIVCCVALGLVVIACIITCACRSEDGNTCAQCIVCPLTISGGANLVIAILFWCGVI
jgi:hypothetical protein